jgi:lipopolysaccharide transport system ATP-binding protein
MADDVIIRAEGLGKKYVIGHKAERERYVALRDVLARGARTVWRKSLDLACGRAIVAGDTVEEFWALKDVSFDVRRGEVLGIIGRNGAGKTTLLKILSRITEPSAGRVTIKGRVASLLEVGTGFHPELSGRENIYLNGAILGMTRAEIRKKFDEIVAFAEVEKFLDTPVKRYSSGMYVRLAFAVAAHLEPEILVVDEVLAVGDAEFQKRCLGKMAEVAGGGRTVLFVSHNMAAIEALCPRSMHIAGCAPIRVGDTMQIVQDYLGQRRSKAGSGIGSRKVQEGLVIEQVRVDPTNIVSGRPIQIQFRFSATSPGRIHECCVLFSSFDGSRVAIIDARASGDIPRAYSEGKFALLAQVAAVPFVEGDFSVGLYMVTDRFKGEIEELAEFSVSEARLSAVTPYPANARGVVALANTTSVALLQASSVAK